MLKCGKVEAKVDAVGGTEVATAVVGKAILKLKLKTGDS